MRMTQAPRKFSPTKEQQSFEARRLIGYGKKRKAKGVKTVQVDKGIFLEVNVILIM